MKIKLFIGIVIILGFLTSCQNEAYQIGYEWAEHLCEIREFEVNGEGKADELTAKEIVRIKGITESASSDFDEYVVGYKKYAEKCEHKEYLIDQLQLSINKREKIIDGSYGR